MDKAAPHPLFKLATELGPLVVFFAANAKFDLFVATGAFMVAIVASIVVSYVVVRHVPLMAIVSAVIVLVFGTLTLVLHDETFIKMKPTIIYGLFGLILGGGLLFGKSFIAIMFDQMFNLTPPGWRALTFRWALFFVAMAVLNEIDLAHAVDRLLGRVQGVRRAADHRRVRDAADAADQPLQHRAGDGGDERCRSAGMCEFFRATRLPKNRRTGGGTPVRRQHTQLIPQPGLASSGSTGAALPDRRRSPIAISFSAWR